MQNYVFHVHCHDRPDPDVLAVTVRDDARAEELARERLGLSPQCKAIDVWRFGRLLCRVSRDGL